MIREKGKKILKLALGLLLVSLSLFESYGKTSRESDLSSQKKEIQRIADYIGKQRPGLARSEKAELAKAIFDHSHLLRFPSRSEFAKEKDIDRVAFLLGVIQTESQFKRTAKSHKGALGYMQIMPDTAKWLARSKSIAYKDKKDLYSTEINIKMGVLYLNDLMKETGSPKDALLAYNAGLGGFRKWGGLSSYPKSIAVHYHAWKEFKESRMVFEDLAFLKAE
ncbi:MAG: lytic transglycosylase domain-containing protein [Leptospira sp.]|nr:lytic transglycosylase domain-containing protein [Leptospira sp.]